MKYTNLVPFEWMKSSEHMAAHRFATAVCIYILLYKVKKKKKNPNLIQTYCSLNVLKPQHTV